MIDWDEAYRAGTTPWEIGKPQPAITGVLESAVRGPKVLDLGCGTGDLACTLARRGYHVTGIDISPTAVAAAKAKSGGLTARFEVQDATKLDLPHLKFNTIFDSGLLHNLHRYGGDVDGYLSRLPEVAARHAFVYVLAISAEAGDGWTITRDYLSHCFPEPTWTDTVVKDIVVFAETGDQKLSMPGFLLRTVRD